MVFSSSTDYNIPIPGASMLAVPHTADFLVIFFFYFRIALNRIALISICDSADALLFFPVLRSCTSNSL